MPIFFGARRAATVLSFSLLPLSLLAGGTPALAQSAAQPAGSASSGGGWFVPKQPAPAAPAAAPRVVRRAVPEPQEAPQDVPDDGGAQNEAAPVLPLPPIPDSPNLPKEAPPPAAVIGVISVPSVMRLSTAADEAQRVLGARRDKLAAAAQKEQAGWRDEQQKLQNDARKLTAEQVQLRERHLQERRAHAQRDFSNRARIIQEAANVSLNQIERELVRIVRQVAQAHGMNLVMHSEQVALHIPEQDITQEVADQLNKVLPHVFIPDENVDPEVLAKSGKFPTTANPQAAEDQVPASAPAPKLPPAQSILRQH
ncbi:OmpH family outer membrane protein [Acidomonas methanolica]|uniref:OmpH family outer membrane protein n=1 Tax=Acidomonas methanolica TaxID=437 RepID=UPI00211A9018|nr:OmpH family outer membrane protein [Acidomonas methanolica]MCQ9155359.1 OmpH family outer membrane protein [Acidomonas methanolica]